MITAWQVSSTVEKMEEFLRFVQQFDAQRAQLERVLPFISRLKRLSEEKEILNKDLAQLGKVTDQHSAINIEGLTTINNSKHSLPQRQKTVNPSVTKQNLNQRTNIINNNSGMIANLTNHNNRLSQLIKQLSKHQQQSQLNIAQLKQRIKQTKINKQQQSFNKRFQLMRELENFISEKVTSLELNVQEQKIPNKLFDEKEQSKKGQKSSKKYNQKQIGQGQLVSVYDKYVGQLVQMESKQMLGIVFNDNNDERKTINQKNSNGKFPLKKENDNLVPSQQKIDEWFVEFGEMKCFLTSLEDRNRKQLVQGLFTGKFQKIKLLSGPFNTCSSFQKYPRLKEPQNINNMTQPINRPQLNLINTNKLISTDKKTKIDEKELSQTVKNNGNNQQKGLLGSIMSLFNYGINSNNTNSTNNNNNKVNDIANNKNNSKGDQIRQERQTQIKSHSKKCQQQLQQQQSSVQQKVIPKEIRQLRPLHQIVSFQQLRIIQEDEVRLRVAEILSQMIQFEEFLLRMVEDKLIQPLNNAAHRILQVNRQIAMCCQEMQRAFQIGVGNNSGEYQQSIGSIVHTPQEKSTVINRNRRSVPPLPSRQQNRSRQYKQQSKNNNINSNDKNKPQQHLVSQNNNLSIHSNQKRQQMQLNQQTTEFFLQIIQERVKQRRKLLHFVFVNVLNKIPYVLRFAEKRWSEIQMVCKEFEEKNRAKYNMKLKATRLRVEFKVINEAMQHIEVVVQQGIKERTKRLYDVVVQGLIGYLYLIMKIDQFVDQRQKHKPSSQGNEQIPWRIAKLIDRIKNKPFQNRNRNRRSMRGGEYQQGEEIEQDYHIIQMNNAQGNQMLSVEIVMEVEQLLGAVVAELLIKNSDNSIDSQQQNYYNELARKILLVVND